MRTRRSGLPATNLNEAKVDLYYLRNPHGVPSALLLHSRADAETVGVATAGHRRLRLNCETFLTGVLVDFVVRP